MNLPFLTLSDPLVTSEGILDPLGFSVIGDALADALLPGFRARMSRPRFLTAMAVSALVCEGLDDVSPIDRVTPPYLAFEWLVVEAFVRGEDPARTRNTPGTLKAKQAFASGDHMCARTYLKTASVFGFHGIYKPLAQHLGVVDSELALGEAGARLVRAWQVEQGFPGFLDAVTDDGQGRAMRRQWHEAVRDSLAAGHTTRSRGWAGWTTLMAHLAPANVGRSEAVVIRQLLDVGEPQRELLRLLQPHADQELPESVLLERVRPHASRELSERLQAIAAYEELAVTLEASFDLMRFLSSGLEQRPLSPDDCAADPQFSARVAEVRSRLERTAEALTCMPLLVQRQFAEVLKAFEAVSTPEHLWHALLERHAAVQRAKLPDGKREWFERSTTGEALVRVAYRLPQRPRAVPLWSRPYRLQAANSFLADLGGPDAA